MSDEKITVRVARMNPATDTAAHEEVFEVPCEQRHSVLTLLHYIYEHYDPTLGYRPYQCGRGLCNSCQVSIDGKVGKGCATPIPAGTDVSVGPANGELVRDLVTILRGGPSEPAILAEWRTEGASHTAAG